MQGSEDSNKLVAGAVHRGRVRLKNDYNQHFVDTGLRPQNYIRDTEIEKRFEEYPKLARLMKLKQDANSCRATLPRHIKANLKTFPLESIGTKFDVIVIDPPWQEYFDRASGYAATEDLTPWSLKEIMDLRIDILGESRCFVFIWCGSTHLEDARTLCNHWGFRRCEDICWVKTNKRMSQFGSNQIKMCSQVYNEDSILQRSNEHCLMGLRGMARRSIDTDYLHANLDADVIIDEEPSEPGSTAKPHELYDVIERFCMGRKRIELFGTDRNIRPGWLTVGNSLPPTKFDKVEYEGWFKGDSTWPENRSYIGGRFVGTSDEIEYLRPKSPSRNTKK